jgi:hypothetical protein
MKRAALLFGLLLGSLSMSAQSWLLPLDSNHYYQQTSAGVSSMDDVVHCHYFLKVTGTVTINGLRYQKIQRSDVVCEWPYVSYCGGPDSMCMRQDTSRKLVIMYKDGTDKILYNFNKNVGDTLMVFQFLFNSTGVYTVTVKDSVLLNDGLFHKRFKFNPNYMKPVIEGVGGLGGLLTPRGPTSKCYIQLDCFGRTNPSASIYSSGGLSVSCPLTTGISEFRNKNSVSVFPNPVTGFIKIESENAKIGSLEIRNVIGMKVIALDHSSTNALIVNTNELDPGFYTLILHTDDGVVTRSILKE